MPNLREHPPTITDQIATAAQMLQRIARDLASRAERNGFAAEGAPAGSPSLGTRLPDGSPSALDEEFSLIGRRFLHKKSGISYGDEHIFLDPRSPSGIPVWELWDHPEALIAFSRVASDSWLAASRLEPDPSSDCPAPAPIGEAAGEILSRLAALRARNEAHPAEPGASAPTRGNP